MQQMTNLFLILMLLSNSSCKKDPIISEPGEIQGFNLLSEITGHWVGSNETAFGTFDWFAFDYRPISASHVHSIYEGGTNQNIITSFFIADFDGQQKIMARNGGWLGNQYRATYFVLDRAEESADSKYYRLVDAVGGEKRSYIELRFEDGTFFFDAYKDNSGSLDEPELHMKFEGTNYNPSYASAAIDLFDFPQKVSEVDLNNKFVDLIDSDSALFLEEEDDPFQKSMHGHLSDLTINIDRNEMILEESLLLYLSTESLINANGVVDFENLDKKVVRTIRVQANENAYTTTYLHPDNYYITIFADLDNNFYPSSGDVSSESRIFTVEPEKELRTSLMVDNIIP